MAGRTVHYCFTNKELYDMARNAGAQKIACDPGEGVFEVSVPGPLIDRVEERLFPYLK
ncbi:MAG: hypothetical protein ACE5J7_01810 [Candidatus Aenigmatarchaeota archaeon]